MLLLAWGMCYWTHCDIHVIGVCVIGPTVIHMLLLAWGMCYWTHCDIHVITGMGYVLLDPLRYTCYYLHEVCVIRPTVIYMLLLA